MSFTNAAETAVLSLIAKNTTWAGVGDATGVVGSGTAGSLYISLHTADPGETGDQTTSEAGYTSYVRVAVARSGAGLVVTGNSLSPAADVSFAACTGSSSVVTHVGIGTASSGAGILIWKGALTPNVSVVTGITPKWLATSTVTLD